MSKTILITGSTDGIGKLTAKRLAERGHSIILHGRNPGKLATVAREVGENVDSFSADFARVAEVEAMASMIVEQYRHIDVLINNAGVLRTHHPRTPEGLDARFVVNTLAPYVLTRRLLPIIPTTGRVINLSSAAQAPVDVRAMAGEKTLTDMQAYAQSKLALTIWTRELARELVGGPAVIAVNPGSLLASKMVKDGFGVVGKDLAIGAEILCKIALDASFATASGKYFDNDVGRFSAPHAAALDPEHHEAVMQALKEVKARIYVSRNG